MICILGSNFLNDGIGPVNVGLLGLPSGEAELLTRVIKAETICKYIILDKKMVARTRSDYQEHRADR